MNDELKHTINLVIGDWSHDGHNISDTVTIRSNLNRKEIEKAYSRGVKKVGVDLVEDVAEDYEDNVLRRDDYEMFVAAGFKFNLGYNDLDDGGFSLWKDTFSELYLFLVQQGNSEFKYEIIDSDVNIHIGGYGLYT